MDELWSYVGSKGNQVWVWIALERQTQKVVGLAFGDRSAATCRELWQSLPADYRKRAIIYTDEWEAYASVLPSKRHRPMPKGSGETNHIERLNNTLRQWCANLVRKTLSFSKLLELHITRIRMVIEHCNARASLGAAV
jgi:insertion element IS1 protein InsB